MMERHIDEVAGRYAGRIHSWDVVNEPFSPWDRQAGHWRKGPWFAAFGPDYVAHALRRAALADKKTRLVLNEAFCEQDDEIGRAVRPALLGLVRDLKGRDVPLHAVGLQAHLKPQLPFDDAGFVRFVEQIAACGVDIYLTELDVDDSSYPDDPVLRDAAVARRYEDFLNAVLAVPAVKAVITWGLDDRHSWYRDLALRNNPAARRLPRPLPFDEFSAPKAAAHALARAFAAAPTHSGSHRP
jgi:endo-1,4-beta-xylanase